MIELSSRSYTHDARQEARRAQETMVRQLGASFELHRTTA